MLKTYICSNSIAGCGWRVKCLEKQALNEKVQYKADCEYTSLFPKIESRKHWKRLVLSRQVELELQALAAILAWTP